MQARSYFHRGRLATWASLICVLLGHPSLKAASLLWKGTVSMDWFTAGNWEPGVVPSAGDMVQIPTGTSVQLSRDTTIAAVELAGTLAGSGALTVQGMCNWTEGDVRLPLVIAPGAHLLISGPAGKGLSGGTIRNSGEVTWTGTGALLGNTGSLLENRGVFEIENDSAFVFCCVSPVATIHNLPEGTIRKTSANGQTTLGEWLLINEGKIDIQTGTLALTGRNHQLNNGGEITGAGRLRVVGATLTLAGASRLARGAVLELASGALDGAGELNGPGSVEWSGGEIRGHLTLAEDVTLLMAGDDVKTLPGGTLNLNGTTLWRGKGDVLAHSDGRINNGGLFEAQSDASFTFCCLNPPAQFNNAGIFRKSAGTATRFAGVALNNSGTVDAQQGTIGVAAGGTNRGVFASGPGSQIEFTAASYLFQEGTTIAGTGSTLIRGAGVTCQGKIGLEPASTLVLADGALAGEGTISGPGTFLWTGGAIRARLGITAEAHLRISGAADKSLDGAQVSNLGTIIWEGAGRLVGMSGSVITNAALFEIHNDSTLSFCCLSPPATFHNQPEGIVRKNLGAGETVFTDFSFRNRGQLDIQSGALAFRSIPPHLEDGGQVMGAGRVLLFTGSSVTGTTHVLAGAHVELAAGPLEGVGGFDGPGTLVWSGGDFRGDLTIASGHTLEISGDSGKNLVGGVLHNEGRVVWTGAGPLIGMQGARVENSGVFEIRNASDLSFCCLSPPATFYNLAGGLLRKTSEGRSAFRSFGLVNTGRMSVQAGSLILPDGIEIQGVCPVQMAGGIGIDLLPSNREALLTWAPPAIADGADNLSVVAFEVQKSSADGPFVNLANVGPDTLHLVVPESCDGPVNRYRIHVVTDGCNGGVSAAASIPRPTAAPQFKSRAPEFAAAETVFRYEARAEDSEGAKVTYLLVDSPAGMTVDPLTGTVQWTPAAALRGQMIPVRIAVAMAVAAPKQPSLFCSRSAKHRRRAGSSCGSAKSS
ncbi:MAG: hypothetical protein U1G07_10045 [Verrucomicrobiota bacterium]